MIILNRRQLGLAGLALGVRSFPSLACSPEKEYVLPEEGTHCIALENNRIRSFRVAQALLAGC